MPFKLWTAGAMLVAAGCTPIALVGLANRGTSQPEPCVLSATAKEMTASPLYQQPFAKYQSDAVKLKGSVLPATCFAAGTPPEVVRAFHDAMQSAESGAWPRGDEAEYQPGTRWTGTLGSPKSLTWSLVPDGLSISSGTGEPVAGSTLFATLDSKFAAQGGRAKWIALIQQVFDRWTQVTGIKYTRVKYNNQDWDDGGTWVNAAGSAGLRGDVRISMKNIDGGSGILAYNYYPQTGDMVLDASENWASTSNNFRFFRNIVQHEHGHGFGLAHICSSTSKQLMEPYLDTSFDGPQHDDVRGGDYFYGDPFEPNNSSATADDFGAVAVPSSTTIGSDPQGTPNVTRRAISVSSDIDFIKFALTGQGTVSFVLTPNGLSYNDVSQSNCSGTAVTNSLAAANLNLEILASNGTTVLATANSAAAGSSETVSNLALQAGTYYAKVSATSVGGAQLYTLSMTTVAINQSLNGNVFLQDYVGTVTGMPITIELRTPGTTTVVATETATLNGSGAFSVAVSPFVPAGSYDVAIKASHWLRKVVPNVAVSLASSAVAGVSLINGDVDGDNSVTVFDYGLLSDAFDTSSGQAGWNPAADLDGDGSVTVFDYGILSDRFDLSGQP